MTKKIWDAIVVGGGSAGLSAALQLGRLRARVLVLDQGAPRNRFAGHMHGVLGRDHTSPLDLLADGRRELERYGVEVIQATVAAASRDDDGFALTTDASEVHRATRVLVAAGLTDRLPAIEGLEARWGRSVFSCPFCDGWEQRDGAIGVIATSGEQLHQILLLRRLSDRVLVLTNGEPPFDDDQLARLRSHGIPIDPRPIAAVDELTGAVQLVDGERIEVGAVFIRSTPIANDRVLTDLGAERAQDGSGWIAVDQLGLTSIPGLWAAGNVVNPMLNVPASIAAGATAGYAMCADLVAAAPAGDEP